MAEETTTTTTTTPSLARNVTSYIGLVIAVVSLANIIFLIVADAISGHANPYLGILAYAVIPAIMVAGIALFVLGIVMERRRRRRYAPEDVPEYPDIDLNHPKTRRIFILSSIGALIFVLISILGSYQAYHYTDTDAFCGTVCHTVMHPEYTAYKQSPHARVGCVGCHVGPGAGWYVRSKISGSYQLYSVAFKKYPKPIQSPVENLVPARETCEKCHWPEKFFGSQLKIFTHFQYDEANTARETRMLIKTGGGSPSSGMVAGIHWHMFNENEIAFWASDRQRQKVEYVRQRNRRTGQVQEFFAQDTKFKQEELRQKPLRVMECIDCHNRPTHMYVPPDRSIDRALLANRIDRTLPYAKQVTVEALSADYNTTPEAVAGIAKAIRAYYEKNYPDVWKGRRAAVESAVTVTQDIFQKSRFPEMKVDWRTHPDNIGHFYFAGCFRCHDDQHTTKEGKAISKDCHACHDVLSESAGGAIMFTEPKNEFQHPVDIGDLRAMSCTECHTGKPMS